MRRRCVECSAKNLKLASSCCVRITNRCCARAASGTWYLRKEWCIYVIENAVRSEPQEHNRYRFWAPIQELEGRYLRVVTLEDKVTIHNAFPDRDFVP